MLPTLYLVLYIFAGVCFGLAAGRVTSKSVDFLALGLVAWVAVPFFQTATTL